MFRVRKVAPCSGQVLRFGDICILNARENLQKIPRNFRAKNFLEFS
jgi:hypothetical protein